MIFGNKVIVSDPCYDYGTWCTSTQEIVPGEYVHEVIIHEMVTSLIVTHKDYIVDSWQLTDATIGVDSGQCGIFDYETYHKIIGTGEYNEQDTFYGKACNLTITDEMFGLMDNAGIVSRSGLGDGCYSLYVAKNSNNEIIGLKVVFFSGKEEEEDYE